MEFTTINNSNNDFRKLVTEEDYGIQEYCLQLQDAGNISKANDVICTLSPNL
jgi:hypothetical protein